MCLAKVTKRYDPPEPDEIKAWKVFYKHNSKLYFGDMGGRVKRGVWLKASKRPKMLGYLDTDEYPNGFHAFTTKGDATRYAGPDEVVVEVRVRRVHTVGKLGSYSKPYSTLVAYELFVPEED